jgi:hypothetical protein
MDNNVLRKRINTFKSSKGTLKNMSNEVIIEVLRAWEQWPGTTADLYRDLDLKRGQLSSIIRRAKSLVKSGVSIESDFTEIEVEAESGMTTYPANASSCGIELVWDNNKVIRFGDASLLLDFLKRAA